MDVHLASLVTAVPPHVLPQDMVQETARRILGPKYSQFERMVDSFTNAGVDRRYSVVPFAWFETPKTWSARNAAYVETATSLYAEAAARAIEAAGLDAAEIDTIVTVSSTGIATPTLEARAAARLGFRPDAMRIPIFGLGCAGGVSGLEIARAQALARPGSHVLFVALETCTLSFRQDRLSKADIIATVLFGDGAAAAVLSTEPRGGLGARVRLAAGRQHMWPDTLDIMGWEVDDTGLGVVFDRAIPAFAEDHIASAARAAFAASPEALDGLDRYVCHPGGARVVEALETAFGLAPGSLDAERDVLRDFGNMSAPTALFVLERVLAAGRSGRMMLAALGPGFTASFLPVEVQADAA